MSFRLIRMCCIGALISIMLCLGIMLSIVTNRVSDYESHIAKSLLQLTMLRHMESDLQQVMISIDHSIDNYESNVNHVIEQLTALNSSAEMMAEPKVNSENFQNNDVDQFRYKLRLLKVTLINYQNEVGIDPSADTTTGLETVLLEIRKDSTHFFQRLASSRIEEIDAGHKGLQSLVKQSQSISLYVLAVGLSLGVIIAVVLTKSFKYTYQ